MDDRDAHAELESYYARRASEYEAIYAKPERQSDLAAMRAAVAQTFRGRHVIEIACGTGWWSRHIAVGAASLDAFDINEETLAIARTKPIAARRVRFAVGDAYAMVAPSTSRALVSTASTASTASGASAASGPSGPSGASENDARYDAAFAGFWWSHVFRRDLPRFLDGLHRVLAPGAKVVFVDNRYVEGSSTPVSRVDDNGDKWQTRRLADGTVHDVLKNFPTPDELRAAIAPYTRDVDVRLYDYYWWLEYTLPDSSAGR